MNETERWLSRFLQVPVPEHLPVGYEHIVRGHRLMLAREKLAVIGVLSLVGTSFVTGWLVLSMVWTGGSTSRRRTIITANPTNAREV